MQISAGSRLGPYELVAPIGAGGMGQVWRARDTRLGRGVAVKILPPELAHDERSKLRFEREARSISQLNHPHICTLLDVGAEYLVMELIEGMTLADRLAKGALPLRDVLRYGAEIASALSAIHRLGIVHRDIKPANVMLTKSGAKLLDFGVARNAEIAGVDGSTAQKVTTKGTVIGTLQYMAPEQLAGAAVDARTDIFALGALLYEMASGKPAFDGATRIEVMNSIVNSEPPPLEPPALEHVTRKCLAKDADDRWQSAHDVAEELRWCGDSLGVAPGMAARARASRMAIALAALMTVASAVLAWMLVRERNSARPPVIVSSINAPEGTELSPVAGNASGFRAIAISPDGSQIVFSAQAAGRKPQLWMRWLSADEAVPLPGTDDAAYPFWSPDQKWIGFFTNGKLLKVPTSGGPPVELCDAPDPRGGTWGARNTILFGTVRGPLARVAANGGPATPATKLAATQQSHRWPSFLPDGVRFVYLASCASTNTMHDDDALFGQILDSDAAPVLLVKASSNPVVASDQLIYASGNTLLARTVDADRFTVGPAATVIARNVNYSGAAALAAFTASENVLAFASSPPSMIRWLSPDGSKSDAFLDPGEYTGILRLCCGDTRVATAVVDSSTGATDLWMLDLARGSKTRLTFSPGNDGSPIWSPDGERIYYTYREEIMSKDVSNPTAKEKTVFARPGAASVPFHISPDGRLLAVRVVDRGKRDADLWIVPLAGDDPPFPLIETRFDEGGPQFSPDGKFLTYTSNESGRTEVYVTPFPSRTKRWQASAGGAFGSPIWHKDQTALFYVSPDRRLMSVPVAFADGEPMFGVPVPLFAIPLFAEHVTIASDGSRLLMSERPMRPGASSMILVQNWRARLPGN